MMSSVTGGCPLALVILLLVSIDPTATEVVDSVSDCAEFFLDKIPPHITEVLHDGNILDQNRYKPICQTLNGVRRFMTLYDTKNKIPVFSAYKYTGSQKSPRPEHWRIDPQLPRDSQASKKDYKHIEPYNRGHLFPNGHANTLEDKNSTFTLTNAVPQDKTFNNGRWNRMEGFIKDVMDKNCFNQNKTLEAFIVTGAIPSAKNNLKNKVNIPETLWTAFCCYSNSKKKWLASAHWGANVEEPKTPIETKSLAELKSSLPVDPFPKSKCPTDYTVSQADIVLNKGNAFTPSP